MSDEISQLSAKVVRLCNGALSRGKQVARILLSPEDTALHDAGMPFEPLKGGRVRWGIAMDAHEGPSTVVTTDGMSITESEL
jgi:hypothetical protein